MASKRDHLAHLRAALEGMAISSKDAAVQHWLLTGLGLDLHENARGTAAVAAAAWRFLRETSDVGQFVAEECETVIADGEACVFESTTLLYERYIEWSRRKGFAPVTLTAFGNELTRLGFSVRRLTPKRWKFRQGLRLKTTLPQPPQLH